MLQVECGFQNSDYLVQFGPTLKVHIGFDPNYRPKDNGPLSLPTTEYHALIDTGATESCIDSSVAATLKLPVVNERPVSGAHGQGSLNVHLAQIYVPDLQFTQYGLFCGVHLYAGGQPHSALLGRTLLNHMTLVYQGDTGSVVLSQAGMQT